MDEEYSAQNLAQDICNDIEAFSDGIVVDSQPQAVKDGSWAVMVATEDRTQRFKITVEEIK